MLDTETRLRRLVTAEEQWIQEGCDRIRAFSAFAERDTGGASSTTGEGPRQDDIVKKELDMAYEAVAVVRERAQAAVNDVEKALRLQQQQIELLRAGKGGQGDETASKSNPPKAEVLALEAERKHLVERRQQRRAQEMEEDAEREKRRLTLSMEWAEEEHSHIAPLAKPKMQQLSKPPSTTRGSHALKQLQELAYAKAYLRHQRRLLRDRRDNLLAARSQWKEDVAASSAVTSEVDDFGGEEELNTTRNLLFDAKKWLDNQTESLNNDTRQLKELGQQLKEKEVRLISIAREAAISESDIEAARERLTPSAGVKAPDVGGLPFADTVESLPRSERETGAAAYNRRGERRAFRDDFGAFLAGAREAHRQHSQHPLQFGAPWTYSGPPEAWKDPERRFPSPEPFAAYQRPPTGEDRKKERERGRGFAGQPPPPSSLEGMLRPQSAMASIPSSQQPLSAGVGGFRGVPTTNEVMRRWMAYLTGYNRPAPFGGAVGGFEKAGEGYLAMEQRNREQWAQIQKHADWLRDLKMSMKAPQ